MEIREEQQGAVTVLKPVGALTGADAEAFKARIEAAVRQSLGRVVVDASAVPFVDSRGLEVLVECTESLAESGSALRLCAVNETVREVLELTGFSNAFEFFEDAGSGARSYL